MKKPIWFRYGIGMMILVLFFSQWSVVQAATTGTEGSKIVNIEVEGLARDEVKKLLESELSTWLQGDPIILKGEYEQLEVPRKSFTFNIDDTLDNWEEQTKPKWDSFFLRKKHVEVPLTINMKEKAIEKLPSRIDKQKTKTNLEIRAGMLSEKALDIIYVHGKEPKLKKVASDEVQFPEEINSKTSKIAKALHKVTIEPDKEFSLLKHIKSINQTDQSLEDLFEFDEEVNFYATAFYKLILQTNLEVVEHHSQGRVPSYGEAGIETQVNFENKQDLKVFNSSNQKYEIQARIDDGTLKLALHAIPTAGSYEYALLDRTYIAPRTVYRYSEALAPGEETMIQSGESGVRVDVYRKQLNGAGQLIDKELLEHVSYPALPNVKLVSTEDATEENTIDEPIGDLEEWMNTFLIDEETQENVDQENVNKDNLDIDSEDSVNNIFGNSDDPTNQTETDDAPQAQLPAINTYVDSLMDAYCMEFKEETPNKSETNATKEEQLDTKSGANTTEVKKGENPYKAKPKVEEQSESKNTSELPVEENELITSDMLKAKEKVCTMNRDSIKKQLIDYLIMDSLVENK